MCTGTWFSVVQYTPSLPQWNTMTAAFSSVLLWAFILYLPVWCLVSHKLFAPIMGWDETEIRLLLFTYYFVNRFSFLMCIVSLISQWREKACEAQFLCYVAGVFFIFVCYVGIVIFDAHDKIIIVISVASTGRLSVTINKIKLINCNK